MGVHPNIVSLYTSWATAEKLYLLLEYVPGADLFEEVRQRGRLPSDTAARYILQMANVS